MLELWPGLLLDSQVISTDKETRKMNREVGTDGTKMRVQVWIC